MRHALRIAIAAVALAGLVPARAQDSGAPAQARPKLACLDQKERRAESEAGRVVRLGAAIKVARSRMPGTVVRARLCRANDGLVYVLTVLARDGKVAQIAVDAVNGTLAGSL
jgi:hypothetical protein